MGWAKYAEDDNERILERLDQISGRGSILEIRNAAHLTVKPVDTPRCISAVQMSSAPKRRESGGIRITCRDCGKAFVFSSKEQRRYKARGLSQPKRCGHCRDVKRNREASLAGKSA